AVRAAAHDSHRRAGLLRLARRSPALRALEHHVRDHAALGSAAARQDGAEDRPVGTRAGRPGRMGTRLGSTICRDPSPGHRAVTDHLEAFLQFLRLNRNASPHTVRAYQSDLSQFLAHAADLAGTTPAALKPSSLDRSAIRG